MEADVFTFDSTKVVEADLYWLYIYQKKEDGHNLVTVKVTVSEFLNVAPTFDNAPYDNITIYPGDDIILEFEVSDVNPADTLTITEELNCFPA